MAEHTVAELVIARPATDANVTALAQKTTPAAMAKAAGLRYVSDRQPGYTRRRRGRGFVYYDWKGNLVADPKLRDRFSQLVIPPAWKEVWICRYENGHIQSVGRDEAGRKQYIYHPAWAQVRDQVKYSKLLRFGEALPDLRQKVATDLRQRKLTRTKVTALVIALMEQTLIRIGNDEYARNNDSYGLTTLQDDHVVAGRASIEGRSATSRLSAPAAAASRQNRSRPRAASRFA